ncbi:MAG TPA: HAD-IA family hydrolase [Trebonia sp.]|nr:HAD-IA family hydrolase [Trebonia sp.]
MATIKAFLVDVYDTILDSSLHERAGLIADVAGVPREEWTRAWLGLSRERDTGALTMAGAFTHALTACGRAPDPALVEKLVAADAELLLSRTSVYSDTAPFFEAARAQGIAVVLVSNCGYSTRGMLTAKGLLDLVDGAVLSCEVGTAKPDPEIYQIALRSLGVPAADAVFLDDQRGYCAGAAAVGVRPIQVVRPTAGAGADADAGRADPRYTPVTSLAEVLPLVR